MNRLTYLSQTLPVNLAENCNHPGVEFLVLDYNSGDDMESWIKDNLSGYIASGLLKYYKTYEPEFFHLAHSKNMIMKLAMGEIIGMIDADNFAGPGYAHWVEQRFLAHGPQTVTTTLRKDSIPYRDQGGKICFSRDLFHAVNGFDEQLIGYGMDDVDLVNRMENAGGQRVFIDDEKYLGFIGHSDLERVVNYRYPRFLKNIYVYPTDSLEEHIRFLYLFKDNTFSQMYYKFKEPLRTNLVVTFHGWTTEREDGRRDGSYDWENEGVRLHFDDGDTMVFAKTEREGRQALENVLTPEATAWLGLKEEDELYMRSLLAYAECQNRLRFVENDRNAHEINPSGWGKGTVFMNFDTSRPIPIV